jgi:hypothetical protein
VDGFSPAARRVIDDQGRRLAALERSLAALSGVGVSTKGGAIEVRATQVGFAGVTTGAWSTTTGYPWKRRKLDRTAFVNPAVQPTGTGAVSIDGLTSYPAGTAGWFEPSPDGVGYVFQPGAGGVVTTPNTGAGTCSCGWVEGLEQYDCISLTVEGALGKCSCLNATQSYPLLYDGAVKGWTIPTTNVPPKFTACGDQQVTPTFFVDAMGNPALTMRAGSTTYRLTLDCCGPNSAYFTGDSALCTGVRAVGTAPDANLFRVKAEWNGPACGVTTFCCPSRKVPRRLYATVETNPGAAVDFGTFTVPVFYDAGALGWVPTPPVVARRWLPTFGGLGSCHYLVTPILTCVPAGFFTANVSYYRLLGVMAEAVCYAGFPTQDPCVSGTCLGRTAGGDGIPACDPFSFQTTVLIATLGSFRLTFSEVPP